MRLFDLDEHSRLEVIENNDIDVSTIPWHKLTYEEQCFALTFQYQNLDLDNLKVFDEYQNQLIYDAKKRLET